MRYQTLSAILAVILVSEPAAAQAAVPGDIGATTMGIVEGDIASMALLALAAITETLGPSL